MSLLKWTGNPFVDAGIASILVYAKKGKPEELVIEDLQNIAHFIIDLYLTEGWKNSLMVIFSSNAAIVSPKYLFGQRKEKYSEFLNKILDSPKPLEVSGDCVCCGSRKILSPADRRRLPLAGKVKSNYLPYLAEGVDLCNICTFAVQCAPLFIYKSGDKLLLLHSNSIKVMRYWALRSMENINSQILKNDFTGCFDEGYKNPSNSIFHIISDLILTYNENWKAENVFLKIIHFTNYTQLPDKPIIFYELPTSVFNFLAEVKTSNYRGEWASIVKSAYHIKKDNSDKKKKKTAKTEVDYTNQRNTIYEKLLKYVPIINNFFSKKYYKVYGSWELLTIYLQEVLFMADKKIEYIKNFADRIAEIIKVHPNGKKRINDFLKVNSYQELRNVFLRLIKDNLSLIGNGKELNTEPLIKIDDYLEYLFPIGGYWRETFDILLFRLYEQLNDWFISEKLIDQITIENEEAIGNEEPILELNFGENDE